MKDLEYNGAQSCICMYHFHGLEMRGPQDNLQQLAIYSDKQIDFALGLPFLTPKKKQKLYILMSVCKGFTSQTHCLS